MHKGHVAFKSLLLRSVSRCLIIRFALSGICKGLKIWRSNMDRMSFLLSAIMGQLRWLGTATSFETNLPSRVTRSVPCISDRLLILLQVICHDLTPVNYTEYRRLVVVLTWILLKMIGRQQRARRCRTLLALLQSRTNRYSIACK